VIIQVTPVPGSKKPEIHVILDAEESIPDGETVRGLLVAAMYDIKFGLTTQQICRLGDGEPITPDGEELPK